MTPLDAVADLRVLPVWSSADSAGLREVITVLLEHGLDAIEVTLRHDDALEQISIAADSGMRVVAAGTVRRTSQIGDAIDAGANLIVSPGVRPDLVGRCRQSDVEVIPGVTTPTDVMVATEMGCTLVKLFPFDASTGCAILDCLAGPFPDVRFMPSGGIDACHVRGLLANPSVAAVSGSWLTAPVARGAGGAAEVATLAQSFLDDRVAPL